MSPNVQKCLQYVIRASLTKLIRLMCGCATAREKYPVYLSIASSTLLEFNIAMKNGPFIVEFSIKDVDFL